ncbi:MAG: HD domain-containing protein [Clostridia bacterium]|nr:HD domain-containing protein [Clostridia bacterium]
MNNKERFLSLTSKIDREGVDKLLKWLESSDFYTCPASTKYHGAYAGGLLEHSLNVYDEAKRLLAAYPEISVPEESVIVAALFHDLCKVNYYATEKRNRKNDAGQWESYDSYTVREKFQFGGHGGKSVFLIQQFMTLTPEEAVAVNCHMGSWNGDTDVGRSYEQFPFAWIIHVADESATYIKEGSR